MEWVAGESLTDMLSDGPLDPAGRPRSSAKRPGHLGCARGGPGHLRLVPDRCGGHPAGREDHRHRMDAAIAGVGAEQDRPKMCPDRHSPARLADVCGGDGYWPGGYDAAAACPGGGRRPCSPRQVSAGYRPPSTRSSARACSSGTAERHGDHDTERLRRCARRGRAARQPFPAVRRHRAGRPQPRDGPAGGTAAGRPGYRSGRTGRPGRGAADDRIRRWPAPDQWHGQALISVVIVLVLAAVARWPGRSDIRSMAEHPRGVAEQVGGPSTAPATC